mmetsp:Transcript_2521/g.3373  ORF Transcript_2521/g.3373 Transcript_2521/m.3373 type:complete len:108 (-) Transcript_2521:349-672(-)
MVSTMAEDDEVEELRMAVAKSSQSAREATKIMVRPRLASVGNISIIHCFLACREGRISTCCVTCSEDVPVLPTAILGSIGGGGRCKATKMIHVEKRNKYRSKKPQQM